MRRPHGCTAETVWATSKEFNGQIAKLAALARAGHFAAASDGVPARSTADIASPNDSFRRMDASASGGCSEGRVMDDGAIA